MDDDRSGVIDREEVARLLRELGIHMTFEKLEYAMHQMDPNGDNEISFEEFEAWYDKQEVRAPPSPRCAGTRFADPADASDAWWAHSWD